MAKSNCPAEDSAPPQASAGQLTPRFLPLSLSGRLLQVTVAISPSAAKGASKGGRFSACIRSEGPRRQMQDFKRWVRGELLWRNRNFFQTEGDTDFRERVSRSIWPSKLGLSGYRILLAKWILSFTEEVFPASWSGADVSHIPALNTSSIHPLHCFRTFCQQDGSPANTDLAFLRIVL